MTFKKMFIFYISLTIATTMNAMEEMEKEAAANLSGSSRPARIVREPVSEDRVLEDVKAFLAALKISNLTHQTSYVERWRYGFNGKVIPIWKRNGGRAEPVANSCIITGAQPSSFYGLWYKDTCPYSTRLFLELEKHTVAYPANLHFNLIDRCEAIIKERTPTGQSAPCAPGDEFESITKIHACCLVDNKPVTSNRIAIAWDDMPNTPQKKSYITILPVVSILLKHMIQSPQPAQIDLDENKIEV